MAAEVEKGGGAGAGFGAELLRDGVDAREVGGGAAASSSGSGGRAQLQHCTHLVLPGQKTAFNLAQLLAANGGRLPRAWRFDAGGGSAASFSAASASASASATASAPAPAPALHLPAHAVTFSAVLSRRRAHRYLANLLRGTFILTPQWLEDSFRTGSSSGRRGGGAPGGGLLLQDEHAQDCYAIAGDKGTAGSTSHAARLAQWVGDGSALLASLASPPPAGSGSGGSASTTPTPAGSSAPASAFPAHFSPVHRAKAALACGGARARVFGQGVSFCILGQWESQLTVRQATELITLGGGTVYEVDVGTLPGDATPRAWPPAQALLPHPQLLLREQGGEDGWLWRALLTTTFAAHAARLHGAGGGAAAAAEPPLLIFLVDETVKALPPALAALLALLEATPAVLGGAGAPPLLAILTQEWLLDSLATYTMLDPLPQGGEGGDPPTATPPSSPGQRRAQQARNKKKSQLKCSYTIE